MKFARRNALDGNDGMRTIKPAQQNSHVEIRLLGSARWNPHDGIRTMESARCNPHDAKMQSARCNPHAAIRTLPSADCNPHTAIPRGNPHGAIPQQSARCDPMPIHTMQSHGTIRRMQFDGNLHNAIHTMQFARFNLHNFAQHQLHQTSYTIPFCMIPAIQWTSTMPCHTTQYAGQHSYDIVDPRSLHSAKPTMQPKPCNRLGNARATFKELWKLERDYIRMIL
ncbi:hypothetical protein MMC31_004928 [Peltigera leucophlebia]|nr:hypothetical protein [Peltigera leucophlebia]